MSKNKSFVRNENNILFGIIGEEETVTGIFSFFRDIGIILILQDDADKIRETLDTYNEIIPTVLEIPSILLPPYSIEKDCIMQKNFEATLWTKYT